MNGTIPPPSPESFLLLISGPSGAGKGSVIAGLMDRVPRLAFSISYTTRAPRRGERDGEAYHFVDTARFHELIEADAFVEHAVVHDNMYGTHRDDLEDLRRKGRIPLLDIDVQGGVNVIAEYGQRMVSVFLFPPSWQELERRLRGRATDDDATIARRLKNARWEVGFAPHYTYWIVNDDLDQAVQRVEAVLEAESWGQSRWPQPPLSGPGE